MIGHRLPLVVYFASFLLFVLVSRMTGAWGQSPVAALLFLAVLLWALNEIWYWISAWLGLAPALVRWWKNRTSDEENRESRVRAMRTEARLTRAASLVLPLAPHVLFAGLLLVDAVTQGALQRWLHLELGAPLFLPSFVSCCVLFAFAVSGRTRPYSLFAFLDEHLDPSLGEERITPAVEPASPPSRFAEEPTPDPLSRRHSREYGKHERRVAAMMEPGELILEATAPIPYAFNRSTRLDMYVGLPFVLGALWAFSMAVKLSSQSAGTLVTVGVFAMAAVFLLAGLLLVTSPLRWKRKLSRTDYFLTTNRVFLAEGDALRQFRWSERLHLSLSPENGENGSIYLTPETRLTAALGKLLGQGAVNHRETDVTGNMNGLLNIPQASRVHSLVLSLIEKEGGAAI